MLFLDVGRHIIRQAITQCSARSELFGQSDNNTIGIVQHRTWSKQTPADRTTILALLHFRFGVDTVQ